MERTVANKSSPWSPTNAGKTAKNQVSPLRSPVQSNLQSKSSPVAPEAIIEPQTTEWLTEGIRRSLTNNPPPPSINRGLGLINPTSGRSLQRQEIAKGESQTKQSLLGIVRSPVPSAVQPKERFSQKSLQLKSPPNPTTPNPITEDNQEQSDSTTKNNQEQSNPLPSAVVRTPATNQPPQTLTPKTNNQPQLGQKNTQKAQLPQNIPGEKGASLQTPNQGKEQAPPMAANGKTSTSLENVKIDQKGKAPASAQEDSQFQAVIGNVKGVALEQKHHQSASEKSQEAQAAAQSPPKEIESQAQEKQVGKIEQAETPPFDAAAFEAALMKRIEEMAPKNLEEADNFKDNNKLDSVKGELDGKVKEEKTASQKPIEEKTKETPDTTGIKPKNVTPLPPNQPGAAPSDVGANQGVPKSKGKGEIEAPMKAESQNIDKQMADAKVTDEQLAKSNEPEFQEALKGKKEAQNNAKQAPQQYRQFEQVNLEKAQSEAVKTAQDKTQGMHSDRTQQLTQVGGKQVETKGKDEQERTKIAGDIDKIYQGTKTNVETILSELDGAVNKSFDEGAAQAKQAFEEYVNKKMKAYKDKRYGGLLGPGKWLVDKLLGMPSEVNAFYQQGRDLYLQKMDGVIDTVINLVGQKLTAAKTEVSNGKKQVQNYVNQLPQNLKSLGQEAAKEIQGKFEQLEDNINSKQEELIDNLAQKYNEKLQEVDAKIDEMKAENRGLIAKVIDSVVGVIKTIIELGKMLLEVLARVASVVPQILKDPIGFFGNLISGIKQGFLSFMGNIAKHLQQGLIGWLTGAIAGTGIEMPESFDLQGIFSLAAQLLGLGYQMIRSKAVNRLGEEKVGWLEKTFDVFRLLATKGISALWELVKDKIGDLKSMVMDAIENFVIEKVIQEGIQFVLSLLNPASAFVKACQGIYRIVKFFIDRAAQIGELISAILDSIVAIAGGNIGQMVKAIENALAKTVPVVISFMASLLGLGDISQKIQAILKKIRQPIEKVIDWLISQAVKFAKKVGKFGKKVGSKIGKKFGFGKGKVKENKSRDGKSDERTMEQKKAQLDLALSESEQILSEKDATPDTVKAKLPKLQSKYQLKSAKLLKNKDNSYYIKAEINPEGDSSLFKLKGGEERFNKLLYEALKELGKKSYKGYTKGEYATRDLYDKTIPDFRSQRPDEESKSEIPTKDELHKLDIKYDKDVIDTIKQKKEKEIEREANIIHKELAKSQIAYSTASMAKYYPNNIFTVGKVAFFVEQANNYYIVPSSKVEGTLGTGYDYYDSERNPVAKNERGLPIGIGFKIGSVEEIYKKYPYKKLELEGAKNILTGFPGSIADDYNSTVFVAAMLAEPSRYSVANITNLLVLSNPELEAKTNVFDKFSMTQGSSDPTGGATKAKENKIAGRADIFKSKEVKKLLELEHISKEPTPEEMKKLEEKLKEKGAETKELNRFKGLYTAIEKLETDPKIEHEERPKIVTDRDLAAVKENSTLLGKLKEECDKNQEAEDRILIDIFKDLIMKNIHESHGDK